MANKILASDVNAVVSMYNSTLGLSLPQVSTGQPILASYFQNMWQQVQAAAAAQNMTVTLPPYSDLIRGSTIHLEAWGTPSAIPAAQANATVTPQTLSFSQNAVWTVPPGVNSVEILWAIAGGGAGGSGTEYGFGGAGGGGGSGGYVRYQSVAVNPGDTLLFQIGQGGQPNQTGIGGAGGDTIITYTSTQTSQSSVITHVYGGQPGAISVNTVASSQYPSAGGVGGSPNGLSGQIGPAGSGDRASTNGVAGAPGPIQGASGGAGGNSGGGNGAPNTGPSTGNNGSGWGSGGGSGGCRDRDPSGTHYWSGGAGVGGYVQITFPSQGATGGDPPQNNSAYSPSASMSIPAGFMSGGYAGAGTVNRSGNAANGFIPSAQY